MLQQSEDRRARRSRRLLKEGLLELMREKKFSDISVRDITERMDLNRGTFYLHYRDTTALLQSLESDMLADAQEMVDKYLPQAEVGSLQPVFEPVLDYIVEHKEACALLFGNNSSSNFVDRLQELIGRNGEPLLRRRFPGATNDQVAAVVSFVTYGLIGLMKSWFDSGMQLPKPELVRTADLLAGGAAANLLHPAADEASCNSGGTGV